MAMWIGIAGMILLVCAWIPQTWKAIKTRKVGANGAFLIIYAAASSLLTAYAIEIHDIIFTLLNALALVQSLINIGVLISSRKNVV